MIEVPYQKAGRAYVVLVDEGSPRYAARLRDSPGLRYELLPRPDGRVVLADRVAAQAWIERGELPDE